MFPFSWPAVCPVSLKACSLAHCTFVYILHLRCLKPKKPWSLWVTNQGYRTHIKREKKHYSSNIFLDPSVTSLFCPGRGTAQILVDFSQRMNSRSIRGYHKHIVDISPVTDRFHYKPLMTGVTRVHGRRMFWVKIKQNMANCGAVRPVNRTSPGCFTMSRLVSKHYAWPRDSCEPEASLNPQTQQKWTSDL